MVMLWVPESKSYGFETSLYHLLCDLGQVNEPLQASISPVDTEDNRSTSLEGGCED